MDISALSFYAGYAFCQAVYVQSILESDALMVPYVVDWGEGGPHASPYPAQTQADAVQLQIEAIKAIEHDSRAWSAGRDGLLKRSDGSEIDVLVITAGAEGVKHNLEVMHMYKTTPFTLVGNFIVQPPHDAFLEEQGGNRNFFSNFVEGVKAHRFSDSCMGYVEIKEK